MAAIPPGQGSATAGRIKADQAKFATSMAQTLVALKMFDVAMKSMNNTVGTLKGLFKQQSPTIVKFQKKWAKFSKTFGFHTKTLGQVFGKVGLAAGAYNAAMKKQILTYQKYSKRIKGIKPHPLTGRLFPGQTGQFKERGLLGALGLAARKGITGKVKRAKWVMEDPLKRGFMPDVGAKFHVNELIQARKRFEAMKKFEAGGGTVTKRARFQTRAALAGATAKRFGDIGIAAGAKVVRPAIGVTGAMGAVAKMPFQLAGKAAGKLGTVFGRMAGLKPAQMKQMGAAFKSMGGLKGMGMMFIAQAAMQFLDALNPFKPVLEALTEIFGVWGEILGTAFTPLIEKLYEVMLSEEAIATLEQLAMLAMQMVMAFLPLVDIFAAIVPIIVQVLLVAMQAALPIVQALGGILEWLVGIIVAGIGYLKPVIDLFGEALNWIGGVIVGIINAIVGAINTVIGGINKLIPGTEKDLATIPTVAAANGAIITQPTLVLAGEAGPEIISPLTGPNAGFGMGGDKVTYNFYAPVSDDMLATIDQREWERSVIRRTRRAV